VWHSGLEHIVKVEIDRPLFDTPKPLFWRLRFELRLAAKAAITSAIVQLSALWDLSRSGPYPRRQPRRPGP
jgi:hypothetical protein